MLRHLVSQKKKRFNEDGYDLDLAYITENIIAMGFPSGDQSDIAKNNSSSLMGGKFSAVERFYRNPVDEVLRFLEDKHRDHYKIYNLCIERVYDPELFGASVANFPFEDHNCPPIEVLHPFAISAKEWLKQDIDNVVIVHCKAGKSRTGLMICVLLLYLGFFKSPGEAIDFYNRRRTHDLKGLTLPSQRRYVNYYHHILTELDGIAPPPTPRYLHRVRLVNCPPQLRTFVEIMDHQGVVHSSRGLRCVREVPENAVNIFIDPPVKIAGDVKFVFKEYGTFRDKTLFYVWVHTYFTNDAEDGYGGDDEGVYRFSMKLLDKFSRKAEFPSDFRVDVHCPKEVVRRNSDISNFAMATVYADRYAPQVTDLRASASEGEAATDGAGEPAEVAGRKHIVDPAGGDSGLMHTLPPESVVCTADGAGKMGLSDAIGATGGQPGQTACEGADP
eukprot:Rmarinus@m.9534